VIERSDITGHQNNPINSPTPEGWQITKATQDTGMAVGGTEWKQRKWRLSSPSLPKTNS
jgi:hypothetical protein